MKREKRILGSDTELERKEGGGESFLMFATETESDRQRYTRINTEGAREEKGQKYNAG